LRRRRHYRRLAILASHLVCVVAGGTALVTGSCERLSQGGFGHQYTSMPRRESLGASATTERIVNATVVVLAPDASGDAKNLALGAGAIVAADDSRAWIVTCSHVAMPYLPVGAWRHAREAQPVWVQLSDGRGGQATVRWTAPPPLDVALIELPIDHAPEPVTIAPETSTIQTSASVTFVPNPYRSGWKVLQGELIKRERHHTPAGAYDLLFTDLPVTFGDSGSGLYDAHGQLIGLNTWTRITAEGPSQGISLPSETMRVLVDAIHEGKLDQLDEAAPPGPALRPASSTR
jgi:S1-C subfamily serine protease